MRFNPFSLLNAFKKSLVRQLLWFATGTPTYLVQLLKTASYNLNELYGEVYADEIDLNSFDGNNNLVGLSSEWLPTIKNFDGEYYRLDFPNKEVEEVSPKFIVPYYVGKSMRWGVAAAQDGGGGGNPDVFPDAHSPSVGPGGNADMQPNQVEHNYRNMLFLLFKQTGWRCAGEPTSVGAALTWWCGRTSTSA